MNGKKVPDSQIFNENVIAPNWCIFYLYVGPNISKGLSEVISGQ